METISSTQNCFIMRRLAINDSFQSDSLRSQLKLSVWLIRLFFQFMNF